MDRDGKFERWALGYKKGQCLTPESSSHKEGILWLKWSGVWWVFVFIFLYLRGFRPA